MVTFPCEISQASFFRDFIPISQWSLCFDCRENQFRRPFFCCLFSEFRLPLGKHFFFPRLITNKNKKVYHWVRSIYHKVSPDRAVLRPGSFRSRFSFPFGVILLICAKKKSLFFSSFLVGKPTEGIRKFCCNYFFCHCREFYCLFQHRLIFHPPESGFLQLVINSISQTEQLFFITSAISPELSCWRQGKIVQNPILQLRKLSISWKRSSVGFQSLQLPANGRGLFNTEKFVNSGAAWWRCGGAFWMGRLHEFSSCIASRRLV